MRYMRLFALLLLLSALSGALTGCGSGSGSSARAARRKVTIQLTLPAAADRAASRAAIRSLSSALVEAFDGPTRVGSLTLTTPAYTTPPTNVVTGTIDLPDVPLTFFANGFSAAPPASYETNPANGELMKRVGNALQPLTPNSDPHPLGHAVALVDAATNIVKFTWNNAIATLKQVTANVALTLGTDVDVTTLIQAQTADGTNVIVSADAFSAVVDTGDANYASIIAGTINPLAAPKVHPVATGLARVTISDNEVNTGVTQTGTFSQQAISTIVTCTISASGGAAQTISLNAGQSSTLLTSVPFYAKSLTYTVTSRSLGSGDTPPAPAASPIYTVAPTFGTDPVSGLSTVTRIDVKDAGGATVTAIPVSFNSTGRNLDITFRAWSNADGTGALLAQGTLANQPPVTNASQDLALTTQVQGFTLSPINPTITLVNPASATTPSSLNTSLVKVTAQINSNLTPPGTASSAEIDPRALKLTLTYAPTTAVATVAAPSDGSGIVITGKQDGTVAITAIDRQNAATHSPVNTVTLQYATGAGGLIIQ